MRYYLIYLERYLPRLKTKYQAYVRYEEEEKRQIILDEIINNRCLTKEQKNYIISEIIK